MIELQIVEGRAEKEEGRAGATADNGRGDERTAEAGGVEVNSEPEGMKAGKGCRRNGNVAKLPKEVREKLNLMLQDGIPYGRIIENLGVEGRELHISNISRWKDGGYQDWLYEQQWREDTRALQESALDTLGDIDHARVNQAALHVATLQIFGALRHLKRGPLHEKLGGDSAAYARLVNALSRATRESLNAQKIQDTRAQASLKRLDPTRKASEKERDVLLHHWRDFFGHDLSESDEGGEKSEGRNPTVEGSPAENDEGRRPNEERSSKSEARNPKSEGIPNSELRTPDSEDTSHANSELRTPNSEPRAKDDAVAGPVIEGAEAWNTEHRSAEQESSIQDPVTEQSSLAATKPSQGEPSTSVVTPESSIENPASEPPSPVPSLQHSDTPPSAPPSPPPLSENCLECGTLLPPLRADGGRPSKFCPICCFPLPPPGCCVESSIEQCPNCRANLPRLLPDGTRPLGHCLKCGVELPTGK